MSPELPDAKKSLDFQVVRKKWVADPAIGQHPKLDENGQFDPKNITWVKDGEIIAPKPEDAPHQVFTGAKLNLEVSQAHDWDGWVRDLLDEGYVEDAPLTYRWTADKGHFLVEDEEGNLKESSSASGRKVQWVAPTQLDTGETTVEIKCTIDDAVGARVGATDAGTRDDEKLERTVSVEVKARTATASFKLLKANGDEAGDTIGGAVSVVLELDLNGAEAGSENAVVRIKETGTEGDVTHGAKEDHIDLPALDFTRKEGWQQWIDADGDGPAEAAWQAATSPPVGTGKWRWSYGWNTAGAPITMGAGDDALKLWNHNGEHTISLAKVDGVVSSTLEFGDESAKVEDKKTTVGNLVIKSVSTSNGTSDYFKFDADSDDGSLTNPTITFEIEDSGDKHRYQWWLWAKPTHDEPNSVAFTGIMPSDGSKTITINAANPQGYKQDHLLTQWGTYTFDLRVKEVKMDSELGVGEPLVDLRSRELSFAQHSIDFVVDGAEGSETTKAQVNYLLQDKQGVNGTETQVDLLNPNFQSRASVAPGAQHQFLYEKVDLHTFDSSDFSVDSSGNRWIVIFGAEDGHANDYRDHQNKRVAVVNKGEPRVFHIEEDWMKLNGKTYHSLASYPILAKVYARAGWIVQSSGVAGEHDVVNLDDPMNSSQTGSPEEPNNQWNRRAFSWQYFDHYSSRHTKKYVHSIGAPFAEGSGNFGWSDSELRYSYTFVGTILKSYGDAPPTGSELGDAVVKTTIHEVGHQFGLSHHSQADMASNADITSNGKLCVMADGDPGINTDFWFCPRHSGLLSTSSFPSTSPVDPPSQ